MLIRYKIIFHLIVIIIIISTFTSCEKVISVDLNNAEPHIVIEGVITDRPGPYIIRLTKSGNYFDNSVLPSVSDATVIISDDTGITDTLAERSAGTYVTFRTAGIPGRTYSLRVISEGREYTASSTMSDHVKIDSLLLVRTNSDFSVFSGKEKNDLEIHCFFRDPMAKNYYRFNVYENDSIESNDYRLYDDQYTNGEETELRIASASAGKIYKIQLYSIDYMTYEYYRGIDEILNQNPFFGSTPANPDNNLSNGALGYFSACTVSTKMLYARDFVTRK